MRFQGMGEIYRSDVGQNKNQILGRGRPPPDGRPDPGKRTCREDHALLIVRDEFRAGYSSIGLLASRARLRFTGTARINDGRSGENELSSNGKCVFPAVSHRRGSPQLSVSICVHPWPFFLWLAVAGTPTSLCPRCAAGIHRWYSGLRRSRNRCSLAASFAMP